MRLDTFWSGVEHEWNVYICNFDGKGFNINLKKGLDRHLDWLDKNKDRYIKSVCKVDVEGVGGWHGYDVELIPEGEPEQDVIFEEYERQGGITW